MTVYTITISEAQRALLTELLDKNRETILLHQSAQAFGTTAEHDNLEPDSLVNMFRELQRHVYTDCRCDRDVDRTRRNKLLLSVLRTASTASVSDKE